MNKKKITTLLTAFLVCLITLGSCSDSSKDKEESTPKTNDFQKMVKTSRAQKMPEERSLVLSGKVDYDMDKIVNYVSLVNGIIEQSSYSLGSKVEKGQTLLIVRSSELNNLQSEMVAAENQLKISKREYESAKDMFEDGMLSQKELYEAEGQWKQAEAEVRKLGKDQSIYGSNTENGLYVIKAPISGYVVEKETKGKGSIISEGESLFAIADLSSVWVIANIYQGNIGAVKEGIEADITTLSYPNEIFKGSIEAISPTFDNEEKVAKAIIKLDNKAMKLRPEMSATIKLKDITPLNMIGIPSDALIFDNNKYYVVKVNNHNIYEVKEVSIMSHSGNTSYISGDVKDGDEIVTKNQLLIYSQITEEDA